MSSGAGLMASALVPGRQQVRVRRDASVAVGRPVHEDDVLQRRHAVEHALGLREEGLVGDDQELRLAVADDELPLLGVLRLVHGDERGAQAVASVGRDGPLDAVVRHDGRRSRRAPRRATPGRRETARPAIRTRRTSSTSGSRASWSRRGRAPGNLRRNGREFRRACGSAARIASHREGTAGAHPGQARAFALRRKRGGQLRAAPVCRVPPPVPPPLPSAMVRVSTLPPKRSRLTFRLAPCISATSSALSAAR